MHASKAIPNISKIILVSSGKGGVGKSTVASNLALALNLQYGKRVGILDADLHGSSIPSIMNLAGSKARFDDVSNRFTPCVNYNIKCMSIDFFRGNGEKEEEKEKKGVIAWRGLMQTKALMQLIWQTRWDMLDFLIVDMPPGTGDIHLTIGQTVAVDGAIIVTTPQDIAVHSSVKGLLLWEKIGIPVIGVVKNMASFSDFLRKESAEERIGKEMSNLNEGSHNYLCKYPLLASIPFESTLLKSTDEGIPFVLKYPKSSISEEFYKIAEALDK